MVRNPNFIESITSHTMKKRPSQQKEEDRSYHKLPRNENGSNMWNVKQVASTTFMRGKNQSHYRRGTVVYSDGFVDVWDKLIEKEEKDELIMVLVSFLKKMFTRVYDHNDQKIRKWAPQRNIQHCCSQCGLNHEARDFIRAILLLLIDHLEKNSILLNYLKDNDFLTQKSFDDIVERTN
jgi:hypothetical protein